MSLERLEHICQLHLEGVGLVLQFQILALTLVNANAVKNGLAGLAKGKVVTHAGLEVLEQTHTGTNVPCGVEVFAAKVIACAKIIELHVLQGKAKLRTGVGKHAGRAAKPYAVAQVNGYFDGAVCLALRCGTKTSHQFHCYSSHPA